MDFGREIARRLGTAESRDPLCANGLGGFASGTVGGLAAARAPLLEPMARHLADYGRGSIVEVFGAEPPFAPGGCIAQAWSVAETLRARFRLDRGV